MAACMQGGTATWTRHNMRSGAARGPQRQATGARCSGSVMAVDMVAGAMHAQDLARWGAGNAVNLAWPAASTHSVRLSGSKRVSSSSGRHGRERMIRALARQCYKYTLVSHCCRSCGGQRLQKRSARWPRVSDAMLLQCCVEHADGRALLVPGDDGGIGQRSSLAR